MAGLMSILEGYNAMDASIRSTRGYQAAREKYGDGPASDPGLFSALQEQELAVNRDERADEQLDLQRRGVDRADRQESRQAEVHSSNMRTVNEERNNENLLNMVQALRQARDTGEDVGTAFDNMSDTLPSFGVDPEDMPAMREAIVENPGLLDQYYEALAPDQTKTIDQKRAATGPDSRIKSKEDVSRTIDQMRDLYRQLDEGGGIVNPDEGAISNLGRRAASSGPGRFIGGALGTENESFRRSIEGLRPSLINAMKSAEEMGARMFDSNKDMELWLATVTDPTQDTATVKRLLDEFEAKYGMAAGGMQPVPINVENTKNQEDYQRRNGTDMDTIYPGYVDTTSGYTFQGGDPGDPENWSAPATQE